MVTTAADAAAVIRNLRKQSSTHASKEPPSIRSLNEFDDLVRDSLVDTASSGRTAGGVYYSAADLQFYRDNLGIKNPCTKTCRAKTIRPTKSFIQTQSKVDDDDVDSWSDSTPDSPPIQTDTYAQSAIAQEYTSQFNEDCDEYNIAEEKDLSCYSRNVKNANSKDLIEEEYRERVEAVKRDMAEKSNAARYKNANNTHLTQGKEVDILKARSHVRLSSSARESQSLRTNDTNMTSQFRTLDIKPGQRIRVTRRTRLNPRRVATPAK